MKGRTFFVFGICCCVATSIIYLRERRPSQNCEVLSNLPQLSSSYRERSVNHSTIISKKQFGKENNSKIICMIITTVSNWETKGRAVRNTWAQRCHKALFFYTKVDKCSSLSICEEPNAIGLDIPDGRDHLTAKTFGALNYSYSKYTAEADYFMKADDDTYVIMENLHRRLEMFRSVRLLYLGKKYPWFLRNGYNSGGAGYILSNEAVQLLLQNQSSFPDGGYEDVEIGKYLAKLGIFPQEDLDPSGKLILHSENPIRVFRGEGFSDYYYINFNGAEFGNKNAIKEGGYMLSNWAASFHYVAPAEMYMFEFLLYHLSRDRQVTENT